MPQFDVEIDRVKTQTLHVTTDQVFSALAAYLGSSYVNQFNKFGRVFQVYVQADAQFRLTPRDIANLMVRNQNGDMIPIGTLAKITPAVGPSLISLYNLYPSATIVGLPAQGYSSGQAMELMEQIADKTLPPGTGYEWTAMSYQEKAVGSQIYYVFGAGDAAGLSGARRPVRELVRADLGDPGGAAVAARPDGGAHGLEDRQQPLCPDRPRSC